MVLNETDFSIALPLSSTCNLHECFPAGGAITYTSNDPFVTSLPSIIHRTAEGSPFSSVLGITDPHRYNVLPAGNLLPSMGFIITTDAGRLGIFIWIGFEILLEGVVENLGKEIISEIELDSFEELYAASLHAPH
jgi:hypothetical protein